jgi:hypothetical protein
MSRDVHALVDDLSDGVSGQEPPSDLDLPMEYLQDDAPAKNVEQKVIAS